VLQKRKSGTKVATKLNQKGFSKKPKDFTSWKCKRTSTTSSGQKNQISSGQKYQISTGKHNKRQKKGKSCPNSKNTGQKRPNGYSTGNNNASARDVSKQPQGILKNQYKDGGQRRNQRDKTNHLNLQPPSGPHMAFQLTLTCLCEDRPSITGEMPADLYFTQACNVVFHNLFTTLNLPSSIKSLLGLSLKFIHSEKNSLEASQK